MNKLWLKRAVLLTLGLVLILSACQPVTPTSPGEQVPAETQQPTIPADTPDLGNPPPGVEPTTTQAESADQAYRDPQGQFKLSLPVGWQRGEVEGEFQGEGGFLRVGYLPEMAFVYPVTRVCEWLANPPGGPVRQVEIAPLLYADACRLVPYPEMSTNMIKLVVENAAGTADQRYFYIEADREHFESIVESVELLNPVTEREAFPYPGGEMRPQDESFWAEPGIQAEELTVEEYAVVEAAIDSPTHFEFMERIPQEVLEKRAAWRGRLSEARVQANNSLLEPFGYQLIAREGEEMELYDLWRGDELVQGEISYFWPVSVNQAGDLFAMVVELWNDGYLLVQEGQVEKWDMSTSLFIPPVLFQNELLWVRWDYQRGEAQIVQGEEQIFAFAGVYLVGMPVYGLWSWDGHWLAEIDGFLFQDGEVLNENLGYEEIFGWQLLDGKPFYYFRKGPRVGVSYDGERLPVTYDEVIHYRCCEASIGNTDGNETMAWFYGLREGVWYYVEMGVYGE